MTDTIDISSLRNKHCHRCHHLIHGGSALYNWVLGYIEELYCVQCLIVMQESDFENFNDTMHHYIESRPCFQKAWHELEKTAVCI